MLMSVMLRVLWVNDDCLIVFERFHYKSRTCNSVCGSDSSVSCLKYATSGAESVNLFWAFSKSHLRFLKPINVIPLITARAMVISIRGRIREFNRKQNQP